jgi:transposase
MNKPSRPTYTAEFKLEAAQLVVDQNYSTIEAAKSMGVSKSAMDKWVRQLKKERLGTPVNGSPLTPDKIKIKELEKKIKRIEMENEIIKKATALLISDSLKSFK